MCEPMVAVFQEGKPQTLAVMKHFLQRFAPGVDRLEGVDHIEGSNGAAVLRQGDVFPIFFPSGMIYS